MYQKACEYFDDQNVPDTQEGSPNPQTKTKYTQSQMVTTRKRAQDAAAQLTGGVQRTAGEHKLIDSVLESDDF